MRDNWHGQMSGGGEGLREARRVLEMRRQMGARRGDEDWRVAGDRCDQATYRNEIASISS